MTSPKDPTKYLGPNVYLANIVVRNRIPTGADYRQPETGKNYVIFTGWQVGKDPTSGTEGDLFLLSKIVGNVAFWMQVSSGVTPSGGVLSLSDTAGTLVFPEVAGDIGNIQLEGGAGITITSDALNNKLVFALAGGGTAVDSFTTNIPGPVTANPATGDVLVNASTTTFTDGATLHTLKTEVQSVTNGILYGQGANTPSATITPSIDGVLISSHTGVPSWLANGVAGQVLTANTNLPPSWQTNSASDLHTAKFIVGDLTNGANYTTIASAITAASAGDTIFIQTGTYTENLTLKAGVNLAAFACDSQFQSDQTSNVNVIGKMSASFTGSAQISGIKFKTNGDFLLEVTGAVNQRLNFYKCFFEASNNTAISCSNASAKTNFWNCDFDVSAAAIAHFAVSAGGFQVFYCNFLNSGASTTANTLSGGSSTTFQACRFQLLLTISNSALVTSQYCSFAGTTTVTSTNLVSYDFCYFITGTDSAISVGAGATCILRDVVVDSSNANQITGAGTISYSPITFAQAFTAVNTTTQTPLAIGPRILMTGGCQILSGAGDPNGAVTAPKGSMWLRTDGGGVNDRAYINTDAGTTWTAIVTVA